MGQGNRWAQAPSWIRVRRAIVQAARIGRKHRVGVARWEDLLNAALARDPLKERAVQIGRAHV